jgi:hypothetical protein
MKPHWREFPGSHRQFSERLVVQCNKLLPMAFALFS